MYDLEERSLQMAIAARQFVKLIPRTVANFEDAKQLIRSTGSVGANYIEANEAISRKDFLLRIKISRKEARESLYWLKIILHSNELDPPIKLKCEQLIQEVTEVKNILSAIINKTS
jgi:four helix bundle protein